MLQVRKLGVPYRSKLLGSLRGNGDLPEYLVVQMYAHGLSSRDRVFTEYLEIGRL